MMMMTDIYWIQFLIHGLGGCWPFNMSHAWCAALFLLHTFYFYVSFTLPSTFYFVKISSHISYSCFICTIYCFMYANFSFISSHLYTKILFLTVTFLSNEPTYVLTSPLPEHEGLRPLFIRSKVALLVGIVRRLLAWRPRVRIPVGAKDLFFSEWELGLFCGW